MRGILYIIDIAFLFFFLCERVHNNIYIYISVCVSAASSGSSPAQAVQPTGNKPGNANEEKKV